MSDLEKYIKENSRKMDAAEPASGHELRFLDKLEDAGLEADPCAGGVLFKNHGEGLALGVVVLFSGLLLRLQHVGSVQNCYDLIACEIEKL